MAEKAVTDTGKDLETTIVLRNLASMLRETFLHMSRQQFDVRKLLIEMRRFNLTELTLLDIKDLNSLFKADRMLYKFIQRLRIRCYGTLHM